MESESNILTKQGIKEKINKFLEEKKISFNEFKDENVYLDSKTAMVKAVIEGITWDSKPVNDSYIVEGLVEGCEALMYDINQINPTCGLRTYSEETSENVKEHYRKMRTFQTVDHVIKCCEKYNKFENEMSIWEVFDHLANLIDVSDPDIDLPNLVHLFQTAEGIREANLPDWLQLTGLIHDAGKILFLKGCKEDGTSHEEQWSIVGDTFVVGCKLPEDIVYPNFNQFNKDAGIPLYNSETGIYRKHCGLDNCWISYGHDEYLYQVLSKNSGVKLPQEALYIIRYHSFYPWHNKNAYQKLENKHDRKMKNWVKLFNQFDLYTKTNINYDEEKIKELRDYYKIIINKYLPDTMHW